MITRLEHSVYDDFTTRYHLKALPMVTIVLGKRNDSKICRVLTLQQNADEPHKIDFALSTNENPLQRSKPNWANYVKGIVHYFDGTPSKL